MSLKPVDIVVLMLTVSLSAVIIMGIAMPVLFHKTIMAGNEDGARIVEAILTTSLAIVSMYVGAKVNERGRRGDDGS